MVFHLGLLCFMIHIFSVLKGDISRFFFIHCKFLLYVGVGFYVFIKNPDHFPQCSVIK